jgi:hypothetical protein
MMASGRGPAWKRWTPARWPLVSSRSALETAAARPTPALGVVTRLALPRSNLSAAMRRVATIGLSMVAVGSLALAVRAPATPVRAAACPGEFRWSVKTLSDDRADLVNYTPVDRTVQQLRAIKRPKTTIGTQTSRLRGSERKAFRVKARLLKVKKEADGDFHLVIQGLTTTGTMVTELPDATCDGAAHSAKRAQMAAARNAFTAACGPATTSFHALSGTATLVGVGFFDKIHNSVGQTPAFLELHPLLSFTAASCRRLP